MLRNQQMTQETVNIIIGGDVCPVGRNLPYFRSGEVESIFNDLLDEFHEADLSIINLECPLIEQNTPIIKTGPNLGVSSDCINGLKGAEIDVVNLANNHISDHGPRGLANTLDVCSRNGIATVGAGENLSAAMRILVRDVGGIRVGILGVAEHEFSIATDNSCGANPFDPIDYVRTMQEKRENCDYLIVLLHGGNEHYQFPSPRLRKVCRFLVEMGADAVIVQHTHCPGCYEEYKNSFIIYGQGNLIFDSSGHHKSFYEGFLVKLLISKDLTSTMQLVPFSQSGSQTGARRLEKERSNEFLEELKRRSAAIADDAFVREQWLEFCRKRKRAYLDRIYGLNFFLTKLIYRDLFSRFFLNSVSLSRLRNTICCESHREVLETLLDNNMI